MNAPRGFPERVWVVIRPSGERDILDRIENIEEWAEGMDVTIAEYRFAEVVHTPPPTKPKS